MMATTAPSISGARPLNADNHFSGAMRRASLAKRPNMLLCWMSTNAAIAAANTATPIMQRPRDDARCLVIRSGGEQRDPGDRQR